MKPFSLITEFAPAKTLARTEKTRLERVWIMVNGKPECRWIDANARR